ncbi:MAG: family 2 glycosyl transferase [Roseibaca calidilacus]|uniref:Family 2 glycosyl transferase n=1 Tax=Roseibaca calidilacus TaxID=1666912 RepID=A0A0P7W1F4_9RHOB|nr:glycosyltransferase [Roseibaca calidilacus]KPP89509.1 MAG: family 2 glycosyl transferase [Roseibaca calidilacus]CUX79387.1 Glycosyl transferase family 2 [Roseibaca calidilacus]
MAANVSCIIPAYNEGPRIAQVLAVVRAQPLIDEVIVVDDASDDDTAAQVLAMADVTLIRQPRNGGKSRAVAAGLRAAKGRIILFLDADLTGLDAQALRALILPVVTGRADTTISLRGNAPWPWRLIGLDYISGERAMTRAFAPCPDLLQTLPRFGMEVAMNRLWLDRTARLQVVAWPKVASPLKGAKRGFVAGLVADIAMLRDIVATVGAREILAQIRGLRRNRIQTVTGRARPDAVQHQG